MIDEVIYELKEEDTVNYEYDSEIDSGLTLLDRKFDSYNAEIRDKMLRFLISKGFNYTICTKILKIFKEKSEEE